MVRRIEKVTSSLIEDAEKASGKSTEASQDVDSRLRGLKQQLKSKKSEKKKAS